jgi:thioredoxin reductase (NADPH)
VEVIWAIFLTMALSQQENAIALIHFHWILRRNLYNIQTIVHNWWNEMSDKTYDIIIIGGGTAGLGAAIYAGRFELKTAVLAEKPGGTITLTYEVANYLGFKKIAGLELAEKLEEHAKEYKIDFIPKKVTKIEKKGNSFNVDTGEDVLQTKTIIFATGTQWRKLNVPGGEEYTGKGVHYCALCDGAFYKDKIVGVVGGSDSAAKEALLLTKYAKKVYIIYRKEKIRAEPITLKKVESNKNIEIINNTNVTEIKGNKFVTSVILDKTYKNSKEFKLDGLFIDIGHIAQSGLAKDIGVELNEKAEINIDRESKTNVKGVFAAGDVADHKFKQAITGVAEGVTAAYSAYHYINNKK